MPEGIAVVVEDGMATIEFVDRSKRGHALAMLLEVGGPDSVTKVTRPRNLYTVPEEVARAAGLLDEVPAAIVGEVQIEGTLGEPTDVEGDETGTAVLPNTYPDGEPDDDWRRPQLDAYALGVHELDTTGLPNKGAVLDAIRNAAKRRQ